METSELFYGYGKFSLDEIHQAYRDFEDKDAKINGESLLYNAAKHADFKGVQILIEGGAKTNVITDSMENTLLHGLADLDRRDCKYMIPKGAVAECTRVLLDAKVSYLRKNVDQNTCLHYAATNRLYEMFAVFAERGLKMNFGDRDGNTPLHVLCEWAGGPVSSIPYDLKRIESAKAELAKNPEGSWERIAKEHLISAEKGYAETLKKSEEYFKCVEIIQKSGADIYVKNNYGKSPLDFAIQSGDKKIAALLKGYFTDGADEESQLRMASGGMTIHKAAELKDYEAIKAIAALGDDLNSFNEENGNFLGMTALGIACNQCDLVGIEILLECGADPNVKNNDGKTAIHSYFNRIGSGGDKSNRISEKMIEALIQKGLDLNVFINDQSDTLLNFASQRYDYTVFEFCVNQNADLNLANLKGETPLMHVSKADRTGAENMQIILLENGADALLKDKNGNSALMYAAMNYNKSLAKNMVSMLMDFESFDLADANNENKTVLDIATENDNEELVKFLLSRII